MADGYPITRAADLAFMRGCVPDNCCWMECVEAAHHALETDGGDEDDRALLAEYDRRWPRG